MHHEELFIEVLWYLVSQCTFNNNLPTDNHVLTREIAFACMHVPPNILARPVYIVLEDSTDVWIPVSGELPLSLANSD